MASTTQFPNAAEQPYMQRALGKGQPGPLHSIVDLRVRLGTEATLDILLYETVHDRHLQAKCGGR